MKGTIFIDLDGTIVVHNYEPQYQQDEFLPGALEKLKQWCDEYDIIITTARSEKDCDRVRFSLNRHDVFIRQWIYNLNTGPRILINDEKEGFIKAKAVRVKRNEGLLDVSF